MQLECKQGFYMSIIFFSSVISDCNGRGEKKTILDQQKVIFIEMFSGVGSYFR